MDIKIPLNKAWLRVCKRVLMKMGNSPEKTQLTEPPFVNLGD